MKQAAETRWLVVGTDGRHVTLGRHTDPTQAEIEAAETALRASGQAGWLAVMRGSYHSREPVELMVVRPLAEPSGTWDAAARAFAGNRKAANRPS